MLFLHIFAVVILVVVVVILLLLFLAFQCCIDVICAVIALQLPPC